MSVQDVRKRGRVCVCDLYLLLVSIHFIFGRQTRKVTPKRKNRNRLLGALQRKAKRKSKTHKKNVASARAGSVRECIWPICMCIYVCECSCKACYLILAFSYSLCCHLFTFGDCQRLFPFRFTDLLHSTYVYIKIHQQKQKRKVLKAQSKVFINPNQIKISGNLDNGKDRPKGNGVYRVDVKTSLLLLPLSPALPLPLLLLNNNESSWR